MRVNKILLTVFLMLFVLEIFSQSRTPPTPPQPNSGVGISAVPPPGLILPIDGGLSLLVIAGAVFGVFKLRKK